MLWRVQRRMVFGGQFEIIIIFVVVAILDLEHNVEAIFQLTASGNLF